MLLLQVAGITIAALPSGAADYVDEDITTGDFEFTAADGTLTILTNAGFAAWKAEQTGEKYIYPCMVESVVIDAGVTAIPDDAFGCPASGSDDDQVYSSLTTVTFADGGVAVESIGQKAFYKCAALTAFPITAANAALESIGASAFDGSGLTSLDLSNCTALESIDAMAFVNCTALASLSFPQSKLNSGSNAYEPAKLTVETAAFHNTALSGIIKLPYNIDFQNFNTFFINKGITGFEFDGAHLTGHGVKSTSPKADPSTEVLPDFAGDWYLGETYAIHNGMLYSVLLGIATETLRTAVVGGVLTIPDGTTEIISSQYKNDLDITRIIIPASVQVIETQAFMGCENLTTVEIADGSHLFYIGEEAFANTPKLQSFSFATPDPSFNYNYTAMGTDVFNGSGISSLSIPANLLVSNNDAKFPVAVIGDSPALATPNVPLTNALFDDMMKPVYGVKDIGFYNCKNLEEIKAIQAPNYTNSYLMDNDGVLFGISYTPDSMDSSGKSYATQIPNGEAYLIQFPPAKVISSGIYNIEAAANALAATYSTYAGKFTYDLVIGAYSFCNATGIETVIIPTNTYSIGEFAFGALPGVTASIKFIDVADPEAAGLVTMYYATSSSIVPSSFFYGSIYGGALNPLTVFLPEALTAGDLAFSASQFFDAAISSAGNSITGTVSGTAGADITYPITERLRLSVFRGSDAHTWAVQNGIAPYYRASAGTMKANPPKDIYQYIPYQFVPSTGLLDNSNLTFHITGDDLPNGFRLVTGKPAQDVGVPTGLLPGTIYGTLFEDAATIAAYGQINFTLHATDGYGNGFSASADYKIDLKPAPQANDQKFNVWPGNGANIDGGAAVTQTGFFGLPTTGQTTVLDIELDTFVLDEAARTMHANKSYPLFKSVHLNGRKLTEGASPIGHYTSEQGSTKVTLNEQTIAGLPEGEYTLAVAFMRTDFDNPQYGTETDNDLEVLVTTFTITDALVPLGSDLPGTIENESGTRSDGANPGQKPAPLPGPYPSVPVFPGGYPVIPAGTENPTGGEAPTGNNTSPTLPNTPNNTENITTQPANNDDDTPPGGGTPAGGGGTTGTTPNQPEVPPAGTPRVIDGMSSLIEIPPLDVYGNIIADRITPVILHINLPYGEYLGLASFNGQPIDHTATEGSTIINIPPSSFESFGDGAYTLEVAYQNETLTFPVMLSVSVASIRGPLDEPNAPDRGNTDTDSSVAAPSVPDKASGGGYDSNSLVIVIIAVFIVCGGIGVALVMMSKKRRSV